MATKLHTFTDRSQAHAKLAALIKAGKHPLAECREANGEYSVWDGPEPEGQRDGQAPATPPLPQLTPEFADLVAEKLAKKLRIKG